MIKHIVTEIGGIENVGVVSICLFFTAFGGTVLWALCQKKARLMSMGALPLRDEEVIANPKGENHHG